MCKAVNDYAKALAEKSKLEGKIENAVAMVKNMMRDGFDIEKALEYAEIDRQTYEKYSENLQ